MQFDGDVEGASAFDGLVELDGVTVEVDAGVVFDGFGNIDGGDRAEGLACLSGGEGELDFQLLESRSDLLSFGDFIGFTLGANFLEVFDLTKVAFGSFIGLAAGDQEVARETATDFNHIGFGAEVFDLFFEDDLNGRHDICFLV